MNVVQFFKNLVHKKRFWIAVSVVVICALGVWAYKAGWRITYAPELETSWECVSAFAAWAGAIGTIAVLVYNHKAIKLSQRSIQQAIDLQLFEKRLELYNAMADDTAFYSAPLSLKIAYNEEIYLLYSDIVELCEKRWVKIREFAQAYRIKELKSMEHGNMCYQMYGTYTSLIEEEILLSKENAEKYLCRYTEEGYVFNLERNRDNTDFLHKTMREKYIQLEEKMRTILNQSIDC